MRAQTVFILGLALASAAAGQNYMIKTVAGNGSSGYSGDGDIALTAQISGPSGVAMDSAGNWYIADVNNKRVRKVTSGGIISTFAGGGTSGRGDGGPALKAQLISPYGVAVDSAGNVYIADSRDSRVRKVGLDGTITTVAGGGNPPKGVGDGGPATSASLGQPVAVALDRSSNLFIADASRLYETVRKVAPDGIISTVAGGGNASPGDGGLAVNAQFSQPAALAVDGAGNLYIADSGAGRIRKVATDGTISTVAGGGTLGRGDGGPATSAQLYSPQGVAVDSTGRLFIADNYTNSVSMVTPGGAILTIAGLLSCFQCGYSGDAGPANSANMWRPMGLALGPAGSIYFADSSNNRIRILIPSGQSPTLYTVKTVAGTSSGGYSGDGGPAVVAQFSSLQRVALDAAGNLYISDKGNSRIRKMTPDGTISTVAGNGTYGYSGDGGSATKAQLSYPYGIAVDSGGNLYIADANNRVVRRVTPAGIISTVAGSGQSNSSLGDGGQATSANLYSPYDVAIDTKGNFYIADGNYRIRKVSTNGIISTIAGNGKQGYSGDGGLAVNAQISTPSGVAVDSIGNVYFGISRFGPIRKVTTDGMISAFAGNGTEGFFGDGGPAVNAGLDYPEALVADAAGNLFIADCESNRIRQVSPDGTINTIAGSDTRPGYGGDGGAALSAGLNCPSGLALDPGGRIYVADTSNNRVRVLIPPAGMPAMTSGGLISAGAFGGFTAVAPGSWIEIYGSNLASGSRLWTGADFNGINAPVSLDGTSVTIGGQAAFIDYISPTQVNAQVPSTVATGLQPVIVTNTVGSSPASSILVNSLQPGWLAPSSFNIGGKQYVAANFADGATYVLPPGAIVGLPSRRARPGDTITLWGIGFGPVVPNIPAGRIVQESSTLAAPFHVYFGTAEATVSFAGLAPNTMGLYQFNVIVPSVASSDVVPLSFTLSGNPASQKLCIAVE